MVSLKNAMRRAVANTPRTAQNGPSRRPASKALTMKVSMGMRVVVVIGSDMDAVSLLERFGVHDFLRGTLATDDAVQSVNPRGMAIDHGKIVRDQDHSELVARLDFRN